MWGGTSFTYDTALQVPTRLLLISQVASAELHVGRMAYTCRGMRQLSAA